jgi:hypothetical protein
MPLGKLQTHRAMLVLLRHMADAGQALGACGWRRKQL